MPMRQLKCHRVNVAGPVIPRRVPALEYSIDNNAAINNGADVQKIAVRATVGLTWSYGLIGHL